MNKNTFNRQNIAHTQSVGGLICEARRRADKTIEECARHLSIPPRYLRALEKENFADLPGLIYEKNFIKRYAEFLRMRPQPLVAMWVDLRQGADNPKPEFVSRVQWWDLFQGPLFWRRSGIVAFILVLTGYVGGQLVEMVSPPQLVLQSPGVGQVMAEPGLVVVGTAAKSATIQINGQLVPTDDSGQFKLPVILGEGSNTIRVVAEKRYGKPAVIERQVFLAPTVSPISSNFAPAENL